MLTSASTATRPQAGGCLKMADERSRPPYSQPSRIPAAYAWPALHLLDGAALFDLCRHSLNEPGTLGLIFATLSQELGDGTAQFANSRGADTTRVATSMNTETLLQRLDLGEDRNDYSGAPIADAEAAEAVAQADGLLGRVTSHLRRHRPDLLA